MKIIFMGTPDFAVPSLKKLINSTSHEVVGVFTQAPKAKNRGMKIVKSPIHDIAENNNIQVYNPKTLKNKEALELINSIHADIIVVVAYGFIIPSDILNSKKYGCLNIHPSMLPKYRGAAPLQRTIINGEKETSVCIMQMDEGLDTGDIILQKNFELTPRMRLEDLHDKCSNIGADLLVKTLDNIETLPRKKQSNEGVSYAHKLSKEEGKINWAESSYEIDCKIRGMNPWPGAYFTHNNKLIKIIESDTTNLDHNYNPGTIIEESLEIACAKGTLILKTVKPEGKQKMSWPDYLRGIKNR